MVGRSLAGLPLPTTWPDTHASHRAHDWGYHTANRHPAAAPTKTERGSIRHSFARYPAAVADYTKAACTKFARRSWRRLLHQDREAA